MKLELKAPMRPAMSKLLLFNGKRHWLPIPARHRELVEAVRVLGIKDEADEEQMKTVEYRSVIGVVPNEYNTWSEIDGVAECLAALTPGQLDAVKTLCVEFALSFGGVGCFFDFLADEKGMTVQEIREKGIFIQTDEGGSGI